MNCLSIGIGGIGRGSANPLAGTKTSKERYEEQAGEELTQLLKSVMNRFIKRRRVISFLKTPREKVALPIVIVLNC